MKSRREFIANTFKLSLAIGLGAGITSCKKAPYKYTTKAFETNAGHIHRLISQDFPVPKLRIQTKIAIIGSGVSGLACGRALHKQGITDFAILEAENQSGGNASYGHTPYANFPWASHYMPIPNNENKEILDFLAEAGIITGYDAQGWPIYRESDLCFDPDERLFINNRWQDGIIPSLGVPPEGLHQMTRFFQLMTDFNAMKGNDGKYIFDIPIRTSSVDKSLDQLDQIPFATYLKENGFNSPHLLWYLNYCCRDDFGAGIEKVSAFAGIHYFASRRGKGANCDQNHFLTWENGNGFLADQLKSQLSTHILPNQICFRIKKTESGFESYVFDIKRQVTKVIESPFVVINTPLFVSKYLLQDFLTSEDLTWIQSREYFPWITAGITLKSIKPSKGEPLSWDNVAYGSPCLGLVYAQHQHMTQVPPFKKVFTYYRPFDSDSAKSERMRLHSMGEEEITKLILEDLKPLIQSPEDIEEIYFRILGHGMISPGLGNLRNDASARIQKAMPRGLHLAHTDLSGYSVFEEGFYHGNAAAKNILQALNRA